MNNGQTTIRKSGFAESFFYSNYFYGICAVALSVEATLQQGFPPNGIFYFTLVFLLTVLYYAYPYIKRGSSKSTNPRTNWYTANYNLMRWNQVIITSISFIAALLFLKNYGHALATMTFDQWLMLLIFPLMGALYYGINSFSKKYNLRKIGWLKPFIIGFTWAGFVTVYPVLFYDIINGQDYQYNWVSTLLFLKNFMFVTVLCIMFDIKDYASDYVCCVKTFVVKLGLRKTIFYLLLPISVLGLAAFIYYAETHQFHVMKVVLNVIPFVLLLAVSWSMKKRRSLLYYLSVVDGLMLVKAVCGCIAIQYF